MPQVYRTRGALPKALRLAVFRRDRWLCSWCERPVIFAPAMKFLEREVRFAGNIQEFAFYHTHWTRANAPLLDELDAVVDHVEAFSRGGKDSVDNLITACNRCNGRKSAALLEAWHARPKRKPVKGSMVSRSTGTACPRFL
jgi:5-methylcytosine-specific restriction endonuclease McrA